MDWHWVIDDFLLTFPQWITAGIMTGYLKHTLTEVGASGQYLACLSVVNGGRNGDGPIDSRTPGFSETFRRDVILRQFRSGF